LALAVCTLGVASAGCIAGFGGLAAGAGDGPLAVGATWTVKGDSHGMRYEQTAVVIDLVERRGEQAYQVEMVPKYGAGDQGVKHFYTQWLRVSDLAILEEQNSWYGVLDNGIAKDDRSRTIYHEPCEDTYGRDLEVGMQWRHECRGVSDSTEWSSSRGYASSTYNRSHWSTLVVEAREEVTVPAGTFQAYRVAVTGPGEDEDITTHVWVSEEACGTSRHPVVRSVGVDYHDEAGVIELVAHDCNGAASPPWTGEGPRRWRPPVTAETEGWPETFAPTLAELGSKFALTPVGGWGEGRPESNPTLTKNGGNGYDDTGAVETYMVFYEVKGNRADSLRLIANRFTNESYALQFSQYPIHEIPERCESDAVALIVAGAVVVQLYASQYPYDNKDTGGVVAQGLADTIALLEERFGVEADTCDWHPVAETPPSWTTTSSGP
jgi:hypothetical protein